MVAHPIPDWSFREVICSSQIGLIYSSFFAWFFDDLLTLVHMFEITPVDLQIVIGSFVLIWIGRACYKAASDCVGRRVVIVWVGVVSPKRELNTIFLECRL